MLEPGLIASRFLHFIAVLSLFGTAVFPLYTFRQRASNLAAVEPKLGRRMWLLMSVSVLLALFSGIAWSVFTAGTMAGDLSQAATPENVKAMFQATDFGPLWTARLILLVLTAALLMRWPTPPAHWAVPVAAGLMLATLAGTGHAHGTEGWGGYIHQASDASHLIAAGVWLGGLWPLGIVIAASRETSRGLPDRLAIGEVLRRFSGVGTVAVAVLVASGMVNSWFLVGTPGGLVWTNYGRLLSLKVALFLLMAMLASANRFWLTPKLSAFPTSESSLARLRLHVFGEQALGLIVVGVVSLLGTLEPSVAE